MDIEQVATVAQGDLDLAYVEENARRLDLWERLAPLLPRRGPGA